MYPLDYANEIVESNLDTIIDYSQEQKHTMIEPVDVRHKA